MKNKSLFDLTILFLLNANTARALLCNRQLILEGDYKMQVLEKCAEPQYVESRVE